MDSKLCTMCNIEKHINRFYQKHSECNDCNCKRGLKRYHEKKGKISNKQKLYYAKKRDKLLQKQNKTLDFKQVLKSHVE